MILTLKELAEYLKLNERTIQRMLKTGQIKGEKIGGQWRFSGSQIDRLFFPEKPIKSEEAVEFSALTQSMLKIPVSRLISPERIILDMKATNMDEAIAELTPPRIFNRLVLDIEAASESLLSPSESMPSSLVISIVFFCIMSVLVVFLFYCIYHITEGLLLAHTHYSQCVSKRFQKPIQLTL